MESWKSRPEAGAEYYVAACRSMTGSRAPVCSSPLYGHLDRRFAPPPCTVIPSAAPSRACAVRTSEGSGFVRAPESSVAPARTQVPRQSVTRAARKPGIARDDSVSAQITAIVFLRWTLTDPAGTVGMSGSLHEADCKRGAANSEVRSLTPVVSRCSFLTSSSQLHASDAFRRRRRCVCSQQLTKEIRS
jgi:hypothetical protein